ncbi:MAG: alpha/beta fold hydrolase [Desulfobacterales bacterium]
MDDWRSLYPFRSRFLEVNGRRMHYVDEGCGAPLVMVHGNPTWSFYFRSLISGLSDRFRCLAPDHVGCGFSDRPTPRDYGFRLQDRVADFTAWMERVVPGDPVTLVVHDWGGMIAAAWAVEHPLRVARLVVLNTAAFCKPEGKPLPPVLSLLRRHPRTAAFLVCGLNLFARGAARTATTRGLPPAVRAGLLAPYRGGWKRRTALLRFVLDIPLSPADPSWSTVAAVDRALGRLRGKPVLILWAGGDFVFDADYLAEWRRRFPAAEVYAFPDAGHYLLEDEPVAALARIADFLARTGGPAD